MAIDFPEKGDGEMRGSPLIRDVLSDDPIEQFQCWFGEAAEVNTMPEAMTLATVDAEGHPDARMVLMKGVDSEGFRFYTNYEGVKAGQVDDHPYVAMVFSWPELERSVRVRGRVERLSGEESDAYFATRDRSSQIGAWASPQSRPLEGRAELERRTEKAELRFEGRPVERPPHWGGYLVRPEHVEFWQGRRGRLHDRFRYTREASGWRIQRLAP